MQALSQLGLRGNGLAVVLLSDGLEQLHHIPHLYVINFSSHISI